MQGVKARSPLGAGLLVVALAVGVWLLWETPVVYPLKIFVVLMHELSHGLAAMLTGGEIVHIELSAAEGGLCVTRGGWGFVVSSAGYLGSLAWGALLLVVAARSRFDRAVVTALGICLVIVTLIWIRSPFGFAYGLLAGGAFVVTGRKLPDWVSDGLLRLIGVTSCLYAPWDIASDVLLRDIPGTDAHALAAATGLPAKLWGVLWLMLSVPAIGVTLWVSLRRPAHLSRASNSVSFGV